MSSSIWGQDAGNPLRPSLLQNGLIGNATEVDGIVNDLPCKVLLDTGSQVSTISQGFCDQLSLRVQPLSDLIRIQGASGHEVPYNGFVEASLTFKDVSLSQPTSLFLVVPDTNYNAQVPVLAGTNLLTSVVSNVTPIIDNDLPSAWQMTLRVLNVESLKDYTASVRCTKQIAIPPHSTQIVRGRIRSNVKSQSVRQMNMSVMVERDDNLSGSLFVHPSAYTLGSATEKISIQVHNHSSKEVIIPAKTSLCQVHQVEIVPPNTDGRDSEFEDPASPSSTESTWDTDELLKQWDWDALPDEVTDEWKQVIKEKLIHYGARFTQHDLDLGHVTQVKHEIKLHDDTPFKEAYRRIPPALVGDVRKHLKEMLDMDCIRVSKSPYASAVVLVKKSDGSLRFCIDMRKLNQRTVKDQYAIPRIDETLDCLHGAKYFSSLDLKSAFWQIEIAEEDKAKTAFTLGPLGFYECNRMCFGLTNAPATFQRLMESCMGDLNLTECVIYLDDIVIFSKTIEEHVERLEKVLQRLEDAGLKLKASKCKLFQKSLKFLGHVVGEEGVSTDPDKVRCIVEYPVPSSVKDVRSFIGFVGYYRRFIKDFAKTARPLHDLLCASELPIKSKRPPPFVWNPVHQQAFEKLKYCVSNAPVLAYADFSKPFTVHTDASSVGLGGILYQQQPDGTERPVCFASRSLSKAEKRYPAHKLEFLALKWCVTDKFHAYLYGAPKFVCHTDNNPLTYVLSSAKLDATSQRWVAALASYNFDIVYRSGKSNIDADKLSRIEWPQALDGNSTEQVEVQSHVVQAVCQSATVQKSYFETVCFNTDITDEIQEVDIVNEILTSTDIRNEQVADPVIGKVIDFLESNRPISVDTPQLRPYQRIQENLMFHNGVLYKQCHTDDGPINQLVLPVSLRSKAFHGIHDNAGHLGRDKTVALAKERFYFPGITTSIADYISKCKRCLQRKALPAKAELVNISSSYPMQLVCTDHLGLGAAHKKKVLVITDHFTGYAQAYAVSRESAEITAKTLFDKFVVHYGFPERLHSDNGPAFANKVISSMCKMAGIEKSRSTVYHPMGNGKCERFNKTLLQMLGTLQETQKNNWQKHIGSLVHAYNCTQNPNTGYSPYYLMYGRHPRLPVDLAFGLPSRNDEKSATYPKFVSSLKEKLSNAYNIAKESITRLQKKNKKHYDSFLRGAELQVGDRVLAKKLVIDGNNKLADRWESDVYIVSKKYPNIPVYDIKPEQGDGKTKSLHRNLLLPISSLPADNGCSNQLNKTGDAESDDGATVPPDDTVDDSDPTEEPLQHIPRTRSRARAELAESLRPQSGNSVPYVSSHHEGYQDDEPDVESIEDDLPEDDGEDTDATIDYDIDEFFQLDDEVQGGEGLEEGREDVEDSKEEKKEEDEEKKEEDKEKKEDDEQKKEDKEIIEDTDEVEETPDAVPDENRGRQRRISDPCPLRRSTRDRRPPSRYDPTVSSLLLYIQHLHNTMYRNQLSLP